MTEIAKVGSSDTLPAARPHRNTRQKYPWDTLEAGEWFQFGFNVHQNSARVMASQMGGALSRHFHVFVGVDGFVYCRRIDGLDPDKRFIKYPRDKYGNVMLPVVPKHPQSEPIEAVGRGRVAGDGLGNDLMPGEQLFTGDDDIQTGEPDPPLPGAGLPVVEKDEDWEI